MLVSNWRSVLARAWSLYGLYLDGFIWVADAVAQAFEVPMWVHLAVLLATGIARVAKQPGKAL
jgi:hypothetical protein